MAITIIITVIGSLFHHSTYLAYLFMGHMKHEVAPGSSPRLITLQIVTTITAILLQQQ